MEKDINKNKFLDNNKKEVFMKKKEKIKLIVIVLILSFMFGSIFGFILTKMLFVSPFTGLIGIMVGIGILSSLKIIELD